MATTNQNSMQSVIITAVKEYNFTNLFNNLKSFIETAENQGCTKNGEFLTRVLRYVWKYLTFKGEVSLTQEELLNVFQPFEYCVNNILKYYEPEDIQNIPNGQFVAILYHVIQILFQKKHDEHAILLITSFEGYIQKALNSSVKTFVCPYINYLYSVIWLSATNIERLGEKEIFKRRELALRILSYDCCQLHQLSECSILCLQLYYKTENVDLNLISHFLEEIWSHCWEYIENCSESCAKLLVLQTTFKWFVLLQQKHVKELAPNFLSIFDRLAEALQTCKCSHVEPLSVMSEIVIFSIKSYLNEMANVSAETIQNWEIQLKTDGKSTETLQCMLCGYQVFITCLSWQVHTSSDSHFVSLAPDAVKNKLKVLSAITCMYLNYFEQTHTTQTLKDYRSHLVSYMLCIIVKILEQCDSAEDILNFIPFSKLYLEKIVSLHAIQKNDENQEMYCDILGSVAKQLVKHELYEEAIPFLQFIVNQYSVLLSNDVKIKLDERSVWRYHKCLSFCYQCVHMYDKALKSLVISILSKKKVAPTDFEYWIKVKDSAYTDQNMDIVKKTFKDVLNEINIPVRQETEIILLENLLFALKKEERKEYIKEECVSVMLLILASNPKSEIKAWILIELSLTDVDLTSMPDIDNNSTPFSLCQQAAALLIEALGESADNLRCKAKLSLAYFFMYYHRTKEILNLNSHKVEEHLSSKKEETQRESDENSNQEEYGCSPAYLNLRLGVETQLFKFLRDALSIWKEIACDIATEPALISELCQFKLCKVIYMAVESFLTSGNENEALVTSFVLHEFSSEIQNNVYDLLSLSAIVEITTSQGYLKLAEKYCSIAEKLLPNMIDDNTAAYSIQVFKCVKSIFYLECEKFDEGLTILQSVFEDPFLKLNTGKSLTLKIEVRLILLRYMQLKKSVYIERHPTDISDCPYDPVTLANQCFADCQKLLKVFTAEKYSDLTMLGAGLRQKILRLLFRSAVIVCELHLNVGLPHKAKFYLKQIIPISQSFFFPFWVSKFLTIWGHIDLICNDCINCEVKLNALEYIFKIQANDNCEPESFNVNNSSEDTEEFDDSFLKTASNVNRRAEIRLAYRKELLKMSSPITHSQKEIVKAKLNRLSCDCKECSLCASDFLLLEINLLKCCYLMAKKCLREALQFLIELKVMFSEVFEQSTVLTKLYVFQNHKVTPNELFQKISVPKNFVSFFTKLNIQLVICLRDTEEFSEALDNINEAEAFLNQSSKVPVQIYPHLVALVTFYKVCVHLNLIGPCESPKQLYKSQLKSSLTTPISIPGAFLTPKRKINLVTQTPVCSRKPKRLSACKAPLKKGIVSRDIKHALNCPTPSAIMSKVQSSFSDFPNDKDDDSIFVSPKNPVSKAKSSRKGKLQRSATSKVKTHHLHIMSKVQSSFSDFPDDKDDDSIFVSPKNPVSKAKSSRKGKLQRSATSKVKTQSKLIVHDENSDDQKSPQIKSYKFFTSKSHIVSSTNNASGVPATNVQKNVFTFDNPTLPTELEKNYGKGSHFSSFMDFAPKVPKRKTRTRTISKQISNPSSLSIYDIENKLAQLDIEDSFDVSGDLFSSTLYDPESIGIEKTRKLSARRTKTSSVCQIEESVILVNETPVGKLRCSKRRACKTVSKEKPPKRNIPGFIEKMRGKPQSRIDEVVPVTTTRTRRTRNYIPKSRSTESFSEEIIDIKSQKESVESKANLGKAQGSSSSELKEKAENMENLMSSLKEAIAAIEHHPTVPLYSDLCKMLAFLMLQEKNGNCSHAFEVAYLLSESFAVSLKNESRFALDLKIKKVRSPTHEQNGSMELKWPISDFVDYTKSNFEMQGNMSFCDRMKQLLVNIPDDWTVVQVCFIENPFYLDTTMGKCLCICRCRRNSVPYIKLIKIDENRDLNDLTSEFKDIRVQNTLSTKASDIDAFWKLRAALNSRVKGFMEELSFRWCGNYKGLFLGLPNDEKRKKRIETAVQTLVKCLPRKSDQEMLQKKWMSVIVQWKLNEFLSNKVNETVNFFSTAVNFIFKKWMSVIVQWKLNEFLSNKVNETVNFFSTAVNFIFVLLDSTHVLECHEISSVVCELYNVSKDDESYETIMKCIHASTTDLKDVRRHPVILILDKDVQTLPWENMSVMRNNPIVREPSLYFLNLQIKLHCNGSNSLVADGVNAKKTFYLLNPTGDMQRTQKIFEDVFSKTMQWNGVAGKEPLKEEVADALTEFDLFLYLGHGSGIWYLQKSGDIKALCCKASAILMGCSSGELTKNGPEMEAYGDALKYYLSGAPCIVANLWDVTDRDIDLFTQTLLQDWLPNFCKKKGEVCKLNIAEAVAKARNVCKLRYLNGGAPVIYGLPVITKCEKIRL